MQTCSKCQRQYPDSTMICSNCQLNLSEYSTNAQTLKRLLENERVIAIRVSVPADACPVCQQIGGTYSKDAVPRLPVAGCSEPHGCMNTYDPVLDVIYP